MTIERRCMSCISSRILGSWSGVIASEPVCRTVRSAGNWVAISEKVMSVSAMPLRYRV